MKRLSTLWVITVVAGALAGCGGGAAAPTTASVSTPTTDPAGTVRLLTHDSFLVSDAVLADFTAATGLKVEVLRAGDAGAMVNQAILTAGNPVADVLFGIDNSLLSRALDHDLFTPYTSPEAGIVSAGLQPDPQGRVTPIDFGDVCLNYDKAAFADTPPPQTLDDLLDPAYRDMLVVEDPATSSPGLAFLLGTIARFPEGAAYTWKDYWAGLRENGVLVAAGWEEAYYGSFSGGSGEGDRPIVVSYASSPVAEVIYAEQPLTEAPTAVITDGCVRQIEFAGILRGTPRPEAARAFIDFMLSRRFQEDIPLNMLMYPARTDAALPPEFLDFTVTPTSPITIDPALLEANRERWIEEWAAVVLG